MLWTIIIVDVFHGLIPPSYIKPPFRKIFRGLFRNFFSWLVLRGFLLWCKLGGAVLGDLHSFCYKKFDKRGRSWSSNRHGEESSCIDVKSWNITGRLLKVHFYTITGLTPVLFTPAVIPTSRNFALTPLRSAFNGPNVCVIKCEEEYIFEIIASFPPGFCILFFRSIFYTILEFW